LPVELAINFTEGGGPRMLNLKRKTIFFIALIILFCFPSAVSADNRSVFFVGAVNGALLLENGIIKKNTAPPLLIFDEFYADAFEYAKAFGLQTEKSDGALNIFSASNDITRLGFKSVSVYTDLLAGESDYFFEFNNAVYVSLQTLAEFAGYEIKLNGGTFILTLREAALNGIEISYGGSNFNRAVSSPSDEKFCEAYPYPRRAVVDPYRAYGYDEMLSDAEALRLMHPGLIKISSIGSSVEGRDITLVELGRGAKKIFVVGSHHAREYVSTTYLMYAIEQYASLYTDGGKSGSYDAREILNKVTFCIVPMMNPDGVNLVQKGPDAALEPDFVKNLPITDGAKHGFKAWKSNVNGVDLNRNYDFGWELNKENRKPGSERYKGPSPASEPETKAVQDYLSKEDFEIFVSFHSQGEGFYWIEYKNKKTKIDELIRKETGFRHLKDTSIASGSFAHYASGNFGKGVLTVELCKYTGPFPYPDKDFDKVWKPAQNILLAIGKAV